MSKKRIVFVSAMLLLLLAVPAGMASSETTVSYHVATDDVFPALIDIDACVILECPAVFNCSDGTVLPNDSTKYSIEELRRCLKMEGYSERAIREILRWYD